jgi:hypothetical protein
VVGGSRRVVGPNLARGGVLLVHDFPPEFTRAADWDLALAPFGLRRRYAAVQQWFGSTLAVFTHDDGGRF